MRSKSLLEELEQIMIDNQQFIESIYELAFGEEAINKGFSNDEVIEKIREYSDNALKWEEYQDDIDLTLYKQWKESE